MLFDLLVAAAEKAGVAYQIGAEPRGTGTDANAIQLSRGGKAAALVSVPLRYMHTPTEVLTLSDIEDCGEAADPLRARPRAEDRLHAVGAQAAPDKQKAPKHASGLSACPGRGRFVAAGAPSVEPL